MERKESACTGKLPGAREKCLPPSAEVRPQSKSTPYGGSQVKEDKPSTQIPREVERAANRLLYGARETKDQRTGAVQDRRDPGGVEWVVEWTYGTVQRLAEKLNIEVEKWEGYPPEEVKESHWYSEKPSTEYLKTVFGEFIVKDRDFRRFTQQEGKWAAERWDRDGHHEEVQRAREKWKKTALRAAARPQPAARPPPKTALEQDIEDAAKQLSKEKELKRRKEKTPPRLKRPKRK
jgi:hypothetical protein